jgi:hypothetical protein
MLIMVFVKKSLKECFEDIKTTSVGAGILGMMVRNTLNLAVDTGM